jgi:hypothetical protein
MHEADHVEAVVLERRLQVLPRAGSKVIEVGVRNERARQRIVTFVAEHSLFDEAERAVFETVAVERAHEREQVDVMSVSKLARHARHHPPRAQYRQVERSAVERRDAARGLDLVAERVEEGGLHAGLGQEELRDAQPAIDRGRDRRREDVRPRAAGQAGGFGVEVGVVARIGIEGRKRDHVLPHHGGAERSAHLVEATGQLAAPGLRPRAGRSS